MKTDKFLGSLSSMGGSVHAAGGDLHFAGPVEVVTMAREAVTKHPSLGEALFRSLTPSPEEEAAARIERLRAAGIPDPEGVVSLDRKPVPDHTAPITAVILETVPCSCGRQPLLYRQGKRSRAGCPKCDVMTEWTMDEAAAIGAWRRSRQG
ncbi:MAG: hypothetical protein GX625_16485 [Clostridiaceae bacterium]|nr:hypothetical protein [Clostridiaceae bacterium]